MSPVKWDEVAHVYEDIVSVLLSTLNPLAVRIDGAGGDGGRDVQIRAEDELHIFECKSFTGRLGWDQNRRRQVEKSLLNAMAHQPDSWTLVVPINHTPGEEAWFNSLKEKHGIECPMYWLGKDWLDRMMLEHPRISRYFIEGVNDEVVRLLRELNAEAAIPNNISEEIHRLDKIAKRLNDIDPYYKVEISIKDGRTNIEHIPRWTGAEDERPIVIGMNFAFPRTDIGNIEAERFRTAIARGDAISIGNEYATVMNVAGPTILRDLAGSSVTVQIGSTRSQIGQHIPGRLVISDDFGRRMATLPVRFRERQVGQSVATIYGSDRTDSVHVSTSISMNRSEEVVVSSVTTGQISLDFQPKSELHPTELLPVLKFGHYLRSPFKIFLELDSAGPISEPAPLAEATLVPEILIRQVERLARIQVASETPFPTPTVFSREQVREIDNAIRLLDGESLISNSLRFTATLSRSIEHEDSPVTEEIVDRILTISLAAYEPIDVCGEKIYLGQGVFRCARVEVVNKDQLRSFFRNEDTGETCGLIVAPIGNEPVTFRLVTPDDPAELQQGRAVILDYADQAG